MDLPEPKPGLVIRYSYLWRDEKMRGLEEGQKDRPCAIILAVETSDKTRVVVAPITHSRPGPGSGALEIPLETCRRIGLDDRQQWIVTQEVNAFTWPGPDLREASAGQGQAAFGQLPYRFAKQVIDAVRTQLRQGRLRQVERDA